GSCGRGRRVHDAADRVHELRPPILLAGELRPARRREPVVPGPLIRLAHAPLRPQPSALHEPVRGRLERAGLDPEAIVGLHADGLADSMAVLRPPTGGSGGSAWRGCPGGAPGGGRRATWA